MFKILPAPLISLSVLANPTTGNAPILLGPAIVAQVPSPDAQRMERLVGLGKLWGKIRVLHPDLATKPIDWDLAFVEAVEKLDVGVSREIYADAVRALLAALGDPATGLDVHRGPSLVEWAKEPKASTWLADGTLLLHLNNPLRFQNTNTETAEFMALLRQEAGKATRILFDLRPEKGNERLPEGERAEMAAVFQVLFDALTPALIQRPLLLPASRVRAHLGYRGDFEGGNTNGFLLQGGKRLTPAGVGPSKALGFLVNDQTEIPVAVMALHQAGLGVLVTEGQAGRNWAAKVSPFRLPEDLTGFWKTADSVFEDGSSECLADAAVIPSSATDGTAPGVLRIIEQWTHPATAKDRAALAPSWFPVFLPDSAYAGQAFPSKAYRTLAAIKFWTTFDQFSPYKKLLDRPWGDNLGDFILALEQARNVQEYQLAVAGMVTRTQDSHGRVAMATGGFGDAPEEPAGLKGFFGSGKIPVALAILKDRPVVLRVWGEAAARAGFRPGDEVLSVDGETAATRMDRFRPYSPASTPQRLAWKLANTLLRGPLGGQGTVKVRRPDSTIETLRVVWSAEGPHFSGAWRSGPAFQMLPGKIGYVDLDRIAPEQIQPMLGTLALGQAVIFDMRGYPSSGAWEAVGHFLHHPEAVAALGETPLILGEPGTDGALSCATEMPIPDAKPKKYQGKVVCLMNEVTQSSAEFTGLFLEAGADATFIGSPTSGANGSVTTVVLPGALRASFTGDSIRHADGRQLQRIGLQPQILVRPTIQGLAEGRDEVLEEAITFLQSQ